MPLSETLKTLRGHILSRVITNKAEVRQGVVLRLLHELGFDFVSVLGGGIAADRKVRKL